MEMKIEWRMVRRWFMVKIFDGEWLEMLQEKKGEYLNIHNPSTFSRIAIKNRKKVEKKNGWRCSKKTKESIFNTQPMNMQ